MIKKNKLRKTALKKKGKNKHFFDLYIACRECI